LFTNIYILLRRAVEAGKLVPSSLAILSYIVLVFCNAEFHQAGAVAFQVIGGTHRIKNYVATIVSFCFLPTQSIGL
jgi:hypothetical protein